MEVKEKLCANANCDKKFKPFLSTQRVCSPGCAAAFAKQKREAKEQREWNKEKKAKEEELRTHSQWLKILQKVFNEWIRLRDHHQPCISCGIRTGQMHAGHYRTVGHAPQLRFDEMNVHKQCAQCNNYKGGNVVEYRINLVKRIGSAEVDRIESDNEPKHYTVPEIQEMINDYKARIKELKKSLSFVVNRGSVLSIDRYCLTLPGSIMAGFVADVPGLYKKNPPAVKNWRASVWFAAINLFGILQFLYCVFNSSK